MINSRMRLKIIAYEHQDDYLKNLTDLVNGLEKIKGFKFVINDFIIINEDDK